MHCADGLRCVSNECRAERTSVLGEYSAAEGRLAMTAGDHEAAARAYDRAIARFETAKVDVPAHVYCEQGHALVALRADKARAELAARVLHRCVRGVPTASTKWRAAIDDLALLGQVGLDPTTLTKEQLADAYMTKEPTAPDASSLEWTVTGDARTRSRTYGGFIEALQNDEAKAAVIPCWETYWRQTHTTELGVTLAFRYRFRLDQNEDFDRAVISIEEPTTNADPALAAAHTCFREALAPVADQYASTSGESSWQASITFALK
jgi:hypothetical protein